MHQGESADITTLAVVQLLLLRREHEGPGWGEGGWGSAISRCPALRCAPLHKYIRWRQPYEDLNDGVRPAQLHWLEGWGKAAVEGRQTQWPGLEPEPVEHRSSDEAAVVGSS